MGRQKSQTGAERLRRFRNGRQRIDYFPSPEATEILWEARGVGGDRWTGGDSKLLDRIIIEWANVTGNTKNTL